MKNFFKNKRVLIAGGSGLVGTNLTRKLLDLKAKVTSSYFTKIREKKLRKNYFKFNFMNFKECLRATKNKDLVYICVDKNVGLSKMRENFFSQIQNHLITKINLLKACKENKVKKIIWVSSATVYQPSKKLIKENDLDFNIDPYDTFYGIGWTYRYLEKIFLYFKREYKLNLSIIRTTSIYGPYDNFDEKNSHVIPGLLKRAISSNKKFAVWGNGKNIRDFIFVEDLCRFIIKVSKFSKLPDTINFSSGKGTSIENLSKTIIRLLKKDIPIKFINKKLSSARFIVLENSRANKIFKKSNKTNLDLGLKKTLEWYLNGNNKQ